MKAAIHHRTGDPDEFTEMLNWLAILLDQGVEEVAVVSHGYGLNLLTKDSARNDTIDQLTSSEESAAAGGKGPWAVDYLLESGTREEKILELIEEGVRFAVCATAMHGRGLTPEDLIDGIEVVPSGVTELIKLQDEGYGYVRYDDFGQRRASSLVSEP